jgi:hypothetical protein
VVSAIGVEHPTHVRRAANGFNPTAGGSILRRAVSEKGGSGRRDPGAAEGSGDEACAEPDSVESSATLFGRRSRGGTDIIVPSNEISRSASPIRTVLLPWSDLRFGAQGTVVLVSVGGVGDRIPPVCSFVFEASETASPSRNVSSAASSRFCTGAFQHRRVQRAAAYRRPAARSNLGQPVARASHAAIPVVVVVVAVGIYLATYSILVPALLALALFASGFSFLSSRLNPLAITFYLNTKPSWTSIGVVFLGALGLAATTYFFYLQGWGPIVPHF